MSRCVIVFMQSFCLVLRKYLSMYRRRVVFMQPSLAFVDVCVHAMVHGDVVPHRLIAVPLPF